MDGMRLDMHMHTEYSRDSRVLLADFAALAREAGLSAVCVTDHDTIEGALRLREMDTGLMVVVGEEITTTEGEVIGLFLERPIQRGLSEGRSLEITHEQGSHVCILRHIPRN